MHIRQLSRWAAAMGLLLAVAGVIGCNPTTMTPRYEPLHPANNASVDFLIQAHDADGISKAELFVYEYELSVQNGMQTATKRNGGTWGLVKTWNYPAAPANINESHHLAGFPANSFVTFRFRVTDQKGNSASEDWTFAAGDWPFGNNPIPLWGNGAPANRIDICFVADTDSYANARAMLGGLRTLIFDGYHTNNGVRAGRKYWQFYYSPQRGHISDYDDGTFVMDIPASVSGSAIIDSAAIIHTVVKRDWASGGNFGTEPTNRGTAVHEAGHAIFNLADEYAGGGHFTSTDPHHNLYNSKTACEAYLTANGWPATDARNVTGTWWAPEPAALHCIMLDDGDATMPDFARTCIRRLQWFYGTLGD